MIQRTKREKIDHFLRYMENNSINKAVFIKKENINYFLEDYSPNFSVLIINAKENQIELQVSKLDYELAKIYESKDIIITKFEGWREALNGCNGVEGDLPVGFLKYVRLGYKIVSKELTKMKMVKNKNEIKNISKAANISDKAVESISEYLMDSRDDLTDTENSIAAKLEYIMKKSGSIKPSFDTIAITGNKTSLPHGMPSDEILKDICLMDLGAVYKGYCSDITRTVLLDPTKEMVDIYRMVNEGKKIAEDSLRSGITTKELETSVRSYFKEYDKYFIHSLGHGVGVEVHENPSISQNSKFTLEENMVVTLEPGLYIGKFGVRIEDLYLVKKDGFKRLSNAKIIEY
ncbi:M24 family metallopeptidase [Methanococcus voltae]|uniref:Xaa-Pro dipeptidase n=1 Tax=Methanococcus voltae PS TaxID=523842 RepID=A0ABT2EWX7_METVO|nr:M24 family metallopeptidase [Methanococcus voltae]MBP2172936.1 Xaa-Pro dipeptidase [Methanococcus voltae]MCS3922442.1 Xaa-Pro dipeptidase [Methanococcus voltae PS]